jgi:DNA-3-methyladenine glycosylase I
MGNGLLDRASRWYPGRMERCTWCGSDPLYVRYHDEEWGSPLHDERKHFEFLLLETQQAGLSWITILRKREAYRRAFRNFDAEAVAGFSAADIDELLLNPGIVRNRRKLEASVKNARAFLGIREAHGSFDAWLWNFVDGKPVVNSNRTLADIPVTSALSDRVSAEMKNLGFAFVGSTTIYAHLQAIGIVNDHLVSCFRYKELIS